MNWLWKLTGGRPMIFIRHEFEDVIVNRPVSSYMDRLGRYWFAFGPWTWDRARMRGSEIIDALQKKEKQDPNTWVSPGGGGGAGGAGSVTVTVWGAGGGGGGMADVQGKPGGAVVCGGGPGVPGGPIVTVGKPLKKMAYVTVVHSDGSKIKEWVPGEPFIEMMEEGLAMLDDLQHIGVSSKDGTSKLH